MITSAHDPYFRVRTQQRLPGDSAAAPSLALDKGQAYRSNSCDLTAVRCVSPAPDADLAVSDCDDLLIAVTERLRLTVGETVGLESPTQMGGPSATVRASVLECVQALEQIRLTLAHELLRRQQLEFEVFDVRATLARARAELLT